MSNSNSERDSSIESHLAALYGRINYEHQIRVTPDHFKLRNMQDLLNRLGSPHLDYPIIHVAGTKGKGSVCTMLGKILSTSLRRTGVYTSPHLEAINQRMAIDGRLITDSQLVDVLSQIDPFILEMDKEAKCNSTRPLTFFEITTAAAFLHFSIQKCDAVVLEVGLGGRLDSTNVCQPVACIITNISVDHTRQLGATVDKIAREKAGIIKDRVPIISGALDPVAAKVIRATADEHNAPIHVLNQEFSVTPVSGDDGVFSVSNINNENESNDELQFIVSDLRLQVIGRHQQANASLAVMATQILNQQGWNISESDVRAGLADVSLGGRTEVVSQSPTIIIDMAHNVASIDALVETIQLDRKKWRSYARRTLIFATSLDKDAQAMLRPLVACFDTIILTRYLENPRSQCESILSEVALELVDFRKQESQPHALISTQSSPREAWNAVSEDLSKDDFVCIAGSAFLVAELRKTVLDSNAEPILP